MSDETKTQAGGSDEMTVGAAIRMLILRVDRIEAVLDEVRAVLEPSSFLGINPEMSVNSIESRIARACAALGKLG